MTDVLVNIPEQGGYGVTHSVQVLSVELDGGAPRLRADRIRAAGTVSASWLLDRIEYTTFMTFWEQNTASGALPFLVDLVTGTFQLARHKATFVPGSLRTTQVNGLTYRVSADLRPERLVMYQGTFNANATGFVFTTPALVNLSNLIGVPVNVQVLGFSINDGVHPPITLDGIYPFVNYPSAASVAITSAALINPDWTVLAGSYPAGPTANVSNVVLINSPI